MQGPRPGRKFGGADGMERGVTNAAAKQAHKSSFSVQQEENGRTPQAQRGEVIRSEKAAAERCINQLSARHECESTHPSPEGAVRSRAHRTSAGIQAMPKTSKSPKAGQGVGFVTVRRPERCPLGKEPASPFRVSPSTCSPPSSSPPPSPHHPPTTQSSSPSRPTPTPLGTRLFRSWPTSTTAPSSPTKATSLPRAPSSPSTCPSTPPSSPGPRNSAAASSRASTARCASSTTTRTPTRSGASSPDSPQTMRSPSSATTSRWSSRTPSAPPASTAVSSIRCSPSPTATPAPGSSRTDRTPQTAAPKTTPSATATALRSSLSTSPRSTGPHRHQLPRLPERG